MFYLTDKMIMSVRKHCCFEMCEAHYISKFKHTVLEKAVVLAPEE